MVLRIVKGEESAECINNTFLVLIPRVQSPTLLTQFRAFPGFIYEEQSACVLRRFIKRSKAKVNSLCAPKLDMMKSMT